MRQAIPEADQDGRDNKVQVLLINSNGRVYCNIEDGSPAVVTEPETLLEKLQISSLSIGGQKICTGYESCTAGRIVFTHNNLH